MAYTTRQKHGSTLRWSTGVDRGWCCCTVSCPALRVFDVQTLLLLSVTSSIELDACAACEQSTVSQPVPESWFKDPGKIPGHRGGLRPPFDLFQNGRELLAANITHERIDAWLEAPVSLSLNIIALAKQIKACEQHCFIAQTNQLTVRRHRVGDRRRSTCRIARTRL